MPKMQLRLDPWAAEYNTAYFAEEMTPDETTHVDPHVEVDTWRPVSPKSSESLYGDLFFTDGSRRVEARVLLEDERKQIAFGAIGTFGIGVVSCCSKGSRKACFVDLEREVNVRGVRRICTLSGGHSLASFDIISALKGQLGQLNYAVVSTEERDADAVVRRIQFEMLNAERGLASSLTDCFPNGLILTDGPRPRIGNVPNVVGYIKTHHTLPLENDKLEVVRSLEEGQRSPLYLISNGDKSQKVFEWFLRLRDPRPWLYSFAGVVRLQAYAGSNPEETLERVCHLADWLSTLLPRFATRQHQDPRAPQQLLPVRALEAELGRRMGNAQIVSRRIMQYISTQEKS